MSAEPRRKMSYSTDIRLRIVYQRIGMGLTFQQIEKYLSITVSTVCRIFKQFEVSGDIALETDARKPRPDIRVLNEHDSSDRVDTGESNLVLT